MPDALLEFRPILQGEEDLVCNTIQTAAKGFDPAVRESFGAVYAVQTLPGPQWHVLLGKGAICGAVAVARRGTVLEVSAVMLLPAWEGMGLVSWMLTVLGREGREEACTELSVKVDAGGEKLAEELIDAGLRGPDKNADNYPAGIWRRAL